MRCFEKVPAGGVGGHVGSVANGAPGLSYPKGRPGRGYDMMDGTVLTTEGNTMETRSSCKVPTAQQTGCYDGLVETINQSINQSINRPSPFFQNLPPKKKRSKKIAKRP